MKLSKKNIFEMMIVIFALFGVVYSFYNVLSERILKSENREEIEKLSHMILGRQEETDRLECNSQIYVKNGEELVQDKMETSKFIYDYKNERLQIIQKDTNEIIEHKKDERKFVYSKGISPLYTKERKKPVNVSNQNWYYFECEKFYGEEKESANLDKISYGYLEDVDDIIRIHKEKDEALNGTTASKYIVTIKNSLREDLTKDMGDTGLQKMLSENGLNATFLKNGYPTVYKLLKDVYNRETEDVLVWLNEDNEMIRLEKDCTFSYYIKVMKENSDLIKSKIGRYNYPAVICIQEYAYGLEADMIELPQKFTEL